MSPRWVCSACRANNMPQVSRCHRCGTPTPAPPDERTLYHAAPRPHAPPWLLALFLVPLTLLALFLAANNPTRADFSSWALAQWRQRTPVPTGPAEVAASELAGWIGRPLIEQQTTTTNYLIASVFELQGEGGAPQIRALGVAGRIIPLWEAAGAFSPPPREITPLFTGPDPALQPIPEPSPPVAPDPAPQFLPLSPDGGLGSPGPTTPHSPGARF